MTLKVEIARVNASAMKCICNEIVNLFPQLHSAWHLVLPAKAPDMMMFRLRSPSLYLSYILFCSSLFTSTSGFTNETDKQALLAIKNQILEDPFEVLSSWNDSIHFCYWQGVSCSPRHQRVTVLDLPSLKLLGSVSPYIGNLTFLNTINMVNNSLHGTIPEDIGKLYRLQHLSLYLNSFQGELPTNLTRCKRIMTIDISYNNLGGKIPSNLASLSRLFDLRLSNNHFVGLIPSTFGNLSSICTLALDHNNLEGGIPPELGQLLNLEAVHLSCNNLSGRVSPSLYNISSINIFVLTDNQFHGSLPSDLGLTLPNLRTFWFGGNKFSGPFPPSIANATGLVQFEIVYNDITGPVPMNLGSLQDLERLNLGANKLGTNKSNDLSFLDSLVNCTHLSQLTIATNGFGGVLPDSLVNLSTTLTLLRLEDNYISGSMPLDIGNLVNLEFLGLSNNMFSGNVPESIGNLFKLTEVYLYGNYITGKLPSSIGNISELSVLALEANMIEGRIPLSMGNCTKLQALDLQYNQLIGMIPGQLVGFSSLSRVLCLNQNRLTGPLPSQVGNLKNLGLLNISGNRLTGAITSALGDCQVLEFLDMHDNLFEGTIPLSLKQLKGIKVLDLSRNMLSGQIPKFLSELPLVEFLNLSYNELEGEVPTEGVFKNVSAFSIVGNMKLCGGNQALQLPACPGKVTAYKKRHHFPHTILPLVTSLPLILLLACVLGIIYRLVKVKQQTNPTSLWQDEYPKLSYAELHKATDGFASTNLIGEGSYGIVYKGILAANGQIVAVKVLNLEQHRAHRSFWNECEILKNIRHRNLIKIITSCSSIDRSGKDFKALIFEYMPNGSLDSWLHSTSLEQMRRKSLNLLQRIGIAIDVASVLEYLHLHCETPITHCDLKPSNILLDDKLCAHVSDFGLARFHLAPTTTSNDSEMSSATIRGTVGYIPPEYGNGATPSRQGDMYSYGILLLEMFTGKAPTDAMFTANFSLHSYVKEVLHGQVMQIVDPHIIEEEKDGSTNNQENMNGNVFRMEVCMASLFQVGLHCSAESPRERMDVKDVNLELRKIRNEYVGQLIGRANKESPLNISSKNIE